MADAAARPRDARVNGAFVLRALAAGLVALALGFAHEAAWISSRGAFICMSLLLAAYLAAEILAYVHREGGTLAAPVVLASVLGFLLPYALGNYVYMDAGVDLNDLEAGNPGYGWMTWMVALALLGVVSMWIGYRSLGAARTGERFWQSHLLKRIVRTRFETLRWSALLACAGVALAARITMFSLGVYGYSTTADLLAETASIRQYLTMAEGLGSLVLVTVALLHFRTPSARTRLTLPLFLLNELTWGFLSGFKSGVVFPFVVVGVAAVVAGHRLPRRYVVAAGLAVVVAYNVIEPFRVLRFQDPDFDIRSPLYVANTLADVVLSGAGAPEERVSTGTTLVRVSARAAVTGMGAQVLHYKDTVGIGPDAPPFLANIVLSPIYAFVPRLLWPSKPTMSAGAWMYRVVLDNAEGDTAVGMGPVSYLYLAGGSLAVVAGFFVLGWVQRFTTVAFLRPEAGALIVFIGLLSVMVQVDSEFGTFLVTYMRNLPILLVVQRLLFAR